MRMSTLLVHGRRGVGPRGCVALHARMRTRPTQAPSAALLEHLATAKRGPGGVDGLPAAQDDYTVLQEVLHTARQLLTRLRAVSSACRAHAAEAGGSDGGGGESWVEGLGEGGCVLLPSARLTPVRTSTLLPACGAASLHGMSASCCCCNTLPHFPGDGLDLWGEGEQQAAGPITRVADTSAEQLSELEVGVVMEALVQQLELEAALLVGEWALCSFWLRSTPLRQAAPWPG